MIKRRTRVLTLCLLLACGGLRTIAQENTTAARKAVPQQSGQAVTNPDTTFDRELASESKEAAGEDETAQFRKSTSVIWFSKLVGISPETGYWIFVCCNFAVIAGAIYWVSRSSLATAFRNRTAAIQKGVEDARRASAEANARLRAIEERLAKLDIEVAGIRAAAEADFAAEEQRIQQAAEADARRVIAAAESEIATAAKNARRELKIYAAELAVDLAAKQIKVDAATDAALLRSFVSELGKDGK